MAAKTETAETLARQLGVSFEQPALLDRALTHRSYINEQADALEDNERLEFLGDAVLDFVVAAMLYDRFPDLPEGELTRLRASLVRTEQLAAVAQNLNLGAMLRLGKGERETGGRSRRKLLCAAFEAVMGALYLDQGIETVQRVVTSLLLPVAEKILETQAHLDAKSQFQEWAQAQQGATPSYRTLNTSGPDHERVFTVGVFLGEALWGEGHGPSKQRAAQAAAEAALKRIETPDSNPG